MGIAGRLGAVSRAASWAAGARAVAARAGGTLGWAAAAVAGVPVLGLAFGQGGYFATAWGWAALAFLWVGAVALVVRPMVHLGHLDGVFLGALVGVAAWTLLSTKWSGSRSESVLEAERTLVYVAAGGALVVVAERSSAGWILGGLLAALSVVCAYALATRLFPGLEDAARPLGQYRLAGPLGYWNALGVLAAIAAVLAVGLAATAARRVTRALTGALPVVLLPTLYFTFGRTAWVALAVGLSSALVVARGRRWAMVAMIVVVAPWSVLAVALAASSSALTAAGAPGAEIADEGRRLAAAIVALCCVSAFAALAQPRVAAALGRLPWPGVRPVRAVAAVAIVLSVAAVAGVVASGGPERVVDRLDRGFSTPPSPIDGHLDQRLFTLYGEGRAAAWQVAWRAAWSHPFAGIGAGSFEQRWLLVRPRPQGFRDVHNLYLETLAELGVVGLALLAAALAAPALAAWRARGHPLAPAAAGALATYLVHAGADWDWEMPAVTIAALGCGAAALALARPRHARRLRWRARAAGVTASAVLAVLALVGLVGNGAVGASIAALRAGDYAGAEHRAAKATQWAPWSREPWRWMGEAQLARGDAAGARRSFRAATREDPRDWELWYGLALASDGSARRLALAHAAALNPLSPEVRALTHPADP